LKVKIDILLIFFALSLFSFRLTSQPSLKGKPGISKQYAITSARFADRSYKFSKLSYMVDEPKLASTSLDSAKFFILESIAAMDSAIIFANDSDLMALDLANISKKFSNKAERKINLAIGAKGYAKSDLAKDATILSANAVADAYHASFYFRGDIKKGVKKSDTPKKDSANKVITKLDVDQSLFTMLNKDLEQKIVKNKQEIEKLNTELTKLKEAAKITKTKTKIKKLDTENIALEAKNNDAKIKLAEINAQITERDKSGKAPPEPALAKGLRYESMEEWNKHIIMDSEMPANLLYQVQVGVYKNQILYEIFKGITPVYGKTTPQGISYSIGMFEKFSDASQARDYVKSVGLTDAFVVAYNNKKRMTPAEAQKLEKK
jgi:hypothetical protein